MNNDTVWIIYGWYTGRGFEDDREADHVVFVEAPNEEIATMRGFSKMTERHGIHSFAIEPYKFYSKEQRER